jgi:hypothetical protein
VRAVTILLQNWDVWADIFPDGMYPLFGFVLEGAREAALIVDITGWNGAYSNKNHKKAEFFQKAPNPDAFFAGRSRLRAYLLLQAGSQRFP